MSKPTNTFPTCQPREDYYPEEAADLFQYFLVTFSILVLLSTSFWCQSSTLSLNTHTVTNSSMLTRWVTQATQGRRSKSEVAESSQSPWGKQAHMPTIMRIQWNKQETDAIKLGAPSIHFVYFLCSLFLTQVQGSSLSPGVCGPYCERRRTFQKSLASAHTIT